MERTSKTEKPDHQFIELYKENADFKLNEQIETEEKGATTREILKEIVNQGSKPVFSIPREYLKGSTTITPHKTWVQANIIAGTIGIPPYNLSGDRILCVYEGDINDIYLQPRLTGPDKLFHGIVATLQPIPLSKCILIDTKKNKITSLIEINTELMTTPQSPGLHKIIEKTNPEAIRASG